MDLDLEQLLQSIATDAPCGAELRDEPAFHEIQAAAEPDYEYLRGPNGKEIARLKPRDWSKVARGARSLLVKGRDLRVQILLLRSLLATDRLAGLAQGLDLVHRSLADYWDSLHPVLDPGETEPAEQAFERLNALALLTVPEGLLAELRRTPVIEVPVLGSLSLREIEIARGLAQAGADEKPVEQPEVEAILKTAGPGRVAAVRADLAAARGALGGIMELFVAKLGDAAAPNFSRIQEMLDQINAALADFAAPQPAPDGPAPDGAAADGAAADEPAADAPAADAPAAGGTGGAAGAGPANATAAGSARAAAGAALSAIGDREQVIQALDMILDYYRREEPSSPIPLLVERVKRLVRKDFLELMVELAPAGVAEFKALAGLEGEPG